MTKTGCAAPFYLWIAWHDEGGRSADVQETSARLGLSAQSTVSPVQTPEWKITICEEAVARKSFAPATIQASGMGVLFPDRDRQPGKTPKRKAVAGYSSQRP
ncbi:MAG: hypothetical protein ACYCSP_06520 [Acidobacteriaceae bacterium]